MMRFRLQTFSVRVAEEDDVLDIGENELLVVVGLISGCLTHVSGLSLVVSMT